MKRVVNRTNYRKRRDLFLSKVSKLSKEKLFFEMRSRKLKLASKWLEDSRRGELPVPVQRVLSEYYLQKNSNSK